jgi:hypothetical protein
MTATLASIVTAIRRRSRRGYLVVDGRVACPNHAGYEVDVDACYSCPLLFDVTVDGGQTAVHCRGLADRSVAAWW